jgi:hypothetical protein
MNRRTCSGVYLSDGTGHNDCADPDERCRGAFLAYR